MASLKDKIDILFTGNRYFTEHKARLEALQRIYGSTNTIFVNNDTIDPEEDNTVFIAKVTLTDAAGNEIKDKDTIPAGEPITYTVILEGKDGKTLTNDEMDYYKKRVK